MGRKTLRPVSDESKGYLKTHKLKRRDIYSRFTLDSFDCECKAQERDLVNKAGLLPDRHRQAYLKSQPPIECRRAEGKKTYNLYCPDCDELVAVTHADDEKLTNYANLHYVCWHDAKSWYGTYGANINPHSGVVTIECCCGNKYPIHSLEIVLESGK